MDIGRQRVVFHSRICSLTQQATEPGIRPRGCDPSLKALKLLKPQFAGFRVSSLLIISPRDAKVIFPQDPHRHITSRPEISLCP